MDNEAADREAAVMAYKAGDPVTMERLARAHLQVRPADESWLVLLAMALQSQGRADEALDVFRALTRYFPLSGIHWSNLGTMLRDTAHDVEREAAFEKAIEAYRHAIGLEPNDATTHLKLGMLLESSGKPIEAREAFIDAANLDPNLLAARVYGASSCIKCNDMRNAAYLLIDRRDWLHQLGIDERLEVAQTLLTLGHAAEVEKILFETLASDPTHTMALTRWVGYLERVNRLDDARLYAAALPADLAMVANPDQAREVALVKASLAGRGNDSAATKTALQNLGDREEALPSEEAAVLFSLAKVCDKQGDIDGAMTALSKGHESQLLKVAKLDPDLLDPDAEPLRRAMTWVSAEDYAGWPPVELAHTQRQDPLFVVGFPRSGTTLLEQILDANPGFRSMDERMFQQAAVDRMLEMGLAYPQGLGELTGEQCDGLRALYWSRVTETIPLAPHERVIDKNPLNMLLLPMTRRLFPNASIILALRHPCDVILSCYMQSFYSLTFMAMCASLERLAHSYVHAMKFWIHHEACMKPRVFHLRYEDMLEDFEGYARRIGDFIGIEDVSAMFDYHGHAKRKGYIATPSYTRVIEPMDTSSVGRWRRYERYFEPVLPILQPIMEHWGYAA